ncbi:MAG TPA: hypothetical protein VGD65_16335 [Chryseosolibacter sp.]
MVKTLLPPLSASRNFEFIGNHKDDSLVIGNYGDAKVVAKGNFDLSGLVYCSKNSVEISAEGEGTLSLRGVCKRVIIRGVRGNTVLDLSQLTSKFIWCESVKDKVVIKLGPTKVIELISLDHEAAVHHDGKAVLMNYALRGNSKIHTQKGN